MAVETEPNFQLRHQWWLSPPPDSRKLAKRRPSSLSIPDPELKPDSPTATNGGSLLELGSWREVEGYTSLRDILSSPMASVILNSPTPRSASDIQIKNWLVQQAAYAYLLPTPSARETCRRRRRRCSLRRILSSCFGFLGVILRRK